MIETTRVCTLQSQLDGSMVIGVCVLRLSVSLVTGLHGDWAKESVLFCILTRSSLSVLVTGSQQLAQILSTLCLYYLLGLLLENLTA